MDPEYIEILINNRSILPHFWLDEGEPADVHASNSRSLQEQVAWAFDILYIIFEKKELNFHEHANNLGKNLFMTTKELSVT